MTSGLPVLAYADIQKGDCLVEHVWIMHLTLTQGMRFDSDAGHMDRVLSLIHI